MSRKGNCWDNAVVERFFGTLKREWTHDRTFRKRQEAKVAVIEYIEVSFTLAVVERYIYGSKLSYLQALVALGRSIQRFVVVG